MNIAYVIPEFVTEKEAGGLATYYDNIARLLADVGNNVTIFVLSSINEDIEYYPGVLVKRICISTDTVDATVPGSFMRLWSMEINKVVRNHIDKGYKIDIIQYANFMGLGFDRLDNVPTVMRVSSFRPYLRAADKDKFDINWRYESEKIPDFLEELSVIKADAVYGPSRLTAVLIQEETGRNISIIESPFYPRHISSDFKEDINLTNKKFIITFGSLKVLKGAKIIGDSIGEVLKRHEDLYWIFAGAEFPWTDKSGKKIMPSEYINEKAGRLSDRVVFLGKISQERLFSIVKNAEMCVMPSRVDNLPNTCIEAMALGKIVVGTKGASFEQLIIDGRSGFLIERENRDELIGVIGKILSLDFEEKARVGEFAKARINKMAPELIREELLNIYKKTISEFGKYIYIDNPQYNIMREKYNKIILQHDFDEKEKYLLSD